MKAQDVKRGFVVEQNSIPYMVKEVERSVPTARGGNTTFRFILNRIPDGQKLDISLRADDDLKEVAMDRKTATFSYRDGTAFVFMDAEDFTQYTLDEDVVGDNTYYISEGLEDCIVLLIDDRAIGVQVPNTVVLEVVETAPELKGASATKRPKPAKLNTGLEISVPEYVHTGEKIRVNTVTGEFSSRA